jgi:hypothetical protein
LAAFEVGAGVDQGDVISQQHVCFRSAIRAWIMAVASAGLAAA